VSGSEGSADVGASSSGGGEAGASGGEEGDMVVADARGFFPLGCKWREVYRKVGNCACCDCTSAGPCAAAAPCPSQHIRLCNRWGEAGSASERLSRCAYPHARLPACARHWGSTCHANTRVRRCLLPSIIFQHTMKQPCRLERACKRCPSPLALPCPSLWLPLAQTPLTAAAAATALPLPLLQGHAPEFWDVRQYQYWDVRRGNWTDKQPAACVVRGMREPTHWKWRNGSPRSAANCNDFYCIYDNLWCGGHGGGSRRG